MRNLRPHCGSFRETFEILPMGSFGWRWVFIIVDICPLGGSLSSRSLIRSQLLTAEKKKSKGFIYGGQIGRRLGYVPTERRESPLSISHVFFSLYSRSGISSNSFLFDWCLKKSKGFLKYTPRDFRLGLVCSLAYWSLFLDSPKSYYVAKIIPVTKAPEKKFEIGLL